MDFVIAAPEYVVAAAGDLGNIGSALSSANLAALVPTSGVLPAGSDSVSAMIAELFSAHAQAYQALSAQADVFHDQFVQLMNSGANAYSSTEAANLSPLQSGLLPVEQALPAALSAPGSQAPSTPAATPLLTGSIANGHPMTAATSGPASSIAAAPAAPITPASSVAGVLYGPGGNGAGAVSTGASTGLVSASEPAEISEATAAQPPLMYGPNGSGGAVNSGARGGIGQSRGFRGALSDMGGREGGPA